MNFDHGRYQGVCLSHRLSDVPFTLMPAMFFMRAPVPAILGQSLISPDESKLGKLCKDMSLQSALEVFPTRTLCWNRTNTNTVNI